MDPPLNGFIFVSEFGQLTNFLFSFPSFFVQYHPLKWTDEWRNKLGQIRQFDKLQLWTFPHDFAKTKNYKHCQRHNEPEDWVLLTKVIYFSHITRANTKTDQILSSSYWLNLLQILPELQLQNNDQTLCSKSEQKFNFMTKPPLPYLQQAVANTILIINISNNKNLNKFWVGIFQGQSHINQVY